MWRSTACETMRKRAHDRSYAGGRRPQRRIVNRDAGCPAAAAGAQRRARPRPSARSTSSGSIWVERPDPGRGHPAAHPPSAVDCIPPLPSVPRARRPALVSLYGGGWVLGNLETGDAICRSLADMSGCAIVAVGCRSAPEHRFPAAVYDTVAARTWSSPTSCRDIVGPCGDRHDRIRVPIRVLDFAHGGKIGPI
jgi:acetyl esterase/lipase